MKRSCETFKQSQDKEKAVVSPEKKFPKPKFEIYAEEMIEKTVRQSGKSGRIYLPPDWVGKNVKVIRLD